VILDPPSFDFGELELGCCGRHLEVLIRNVGRAPARVFDLQFEDLSASGELVLASPLPDDDDPDTVDLLLDPGDEAAVTVWYWPVDVEPDVSVLRVTTDSPGESDDGVSAVQFGRAGYGPTQTDAFLQTGNRVVDVLFVIDNSVSMGDQQWGLERNLPAFFEIADELVLDYQLAVTTTDLGECGQFEGEIPIVDRDTPDAAAVFASNALVGTDGAGVEQGFHCAFRALEDAEGNLGANAGFLRPEAGLRVVFISDEEEQSEPIWGWGAPEYVEYFQSHKPNPDHVVVSSLSGGLYGCCGAGSASPGIRYVQAALLTGGLAMDVCDVDWAAALAAIAFDADHLADTFELSRVPVPDTVEVRVEGVPIFVGWQYEPALNAVVFEQEYVPENSAEVEIEYSIWGDCCEG